jgi:hypothetical protein
MTVTKQIAALTRQYLKQNDIKIKEFKDARNKNESEAAALAKNLKAGEIAQNTYDDTARKFDMASKSLLADVETWSNETLSAYNTEISGLTDLKPAEAAEMSALTKVNLATSEIKKMLRNPATTYTQSRMLLDMLDKTDPTTAEHIRGAQKTLLDACMTAQNDQVSYTTQYMRDKTPMASKLQHLNYTDSVTSHHTKAIADAEAAYDAALA